MVPYRLLIGADPDRYNYPDPSVPIKLLNYDILIIILRLILIHITPLGHTPRPTNVSIGGSRYFVTFIDDYTRHTWVCLITKKREAFACFLKVKSC